MDTLNRPVQGIGKISLRVRDLSHACIVRDKLQQIPLWVGEVQQANMQPL